MDQSVCKAIAGDRISLESLLLRYHDPVLHYIQQRMPGKLQSEASAEDILQETFIEVFRGIHSLEARGADAFFAWLKTIARTRLINRIHAARALKRGGDRHRLTQVQLDHVTATSLLHLLPSPDPTPSSAVRRAEATQAIVRALAQLPAEKRKLIELRYGQNLSIETIASRLKKGESAIKMALSRTLEELRQIMGTFGDFTAGM